MEYHQLDRFLEECDNLDLDDLENLELDFENEELPRRPNSSQIDASSTSESNNKDTNLEDSTSGSGMFEDEFQSSDDEATEGSVNNLNEVASLDTLNSVESDFHDDEYNVFHEGNMGNEENNRANFHLESDTCTKIHPEGERALVNTQKHEGHEEHEEFEEEFSPPQGITSLRSPDIYRRNRSITEIITTHSSSDDNLAAYTAGGLIESVDNGDEDLDEDSNEEDIDSSINTFDDSQSVDEVKDKIRRNAMVSSREDKKIHSPNSEGRDLQSSHTSNHSEVNNWRNQSIPREKNATFTDTPTVSTAQNLNIDDELKTLEDELEKELGSEPSEDESEKPIKIEKRMRSRVETDCTQLDQKVTEAETLLNHTNINSGDKTSTIDDSQLSVDINDVAVGLKYNEDSTSVLSNNSNTSLDKEEIQEIVHTQIFISNEEQHEDLASPHKIIIGSSSDEMDCSTFENREPDNLLSIIKDVKSNEVSIDESLLQINDKQQVLTPSPAVEGSSVNILEEEKYLATSDKSHSLLNQIQNHENSNEHDSLEISRDLSTDARLDLANDNDANIPQFNGHNHQNSDEITEGIDTLHDTITRIKEKALNFGSSLVESIEGNSNSEKSISSSFQTPTKNRYQKLQFEPSSSTPKKKAMETYGHIPRLKPEDSSLPTFDGEKWTRTLATSCNLNFISENTSTHVYQTSLDDASIRETSILEARQQVSSMKKYLKAILNPTAAVGIYASSHTDIFTAIIACIELGRMFVTLPTSLNCTQILPIVEEANIQLILSDESMQPQIQEVSQSTKTANVFIGCGSYNPNIEGSTSNSFSELHFPQEPIQKEQDFPDSQPGCCLVDENGSAFILTRGQLKAAIASAKASIHNLSNNDSLFVSGVDVLIPTHLTASLAVLAAGGILSFMESKSLNSEVLLFHTQNLKPSLVLMDNIYANIAMQLGKDKEREGGYLKKYIFKRAFEEKKAAQERGIETPFWNFLLVDKTKVIVGGNARMIISTTVLDAESWDYLRVILDAQVIQIYGEAATGGICLTQLYNDFDHSLGTVAPGYEMYAGDSNQICIRGGATSQNQLFEEPSIKFEGYILPFKGSIDETTGVVRPYISDSIK